MLFGVTGGIGSGKSYVCRLIESQGYPVYDCDAHARRLMTDHPELVEAVKQLIGDDAYDQYGNLNKPVVAHYLFGSSEHASRLNSIVHPVVRQDFLRWAQDQKSDNVFVESAILFEAHFDEVVDKVICVTAPLRLRLKRVMQRDHCEEAAVRQRIQHQMDDVELQRRSDFIIVNDGRQNLDTQLQTIINPKI